MGERAGAASLDFGNAGIEGQTTLRALFVAVQQVIHRPPGDSGTNGWTDAVKRSAAGLSNRPRSLRTLAMTFTSLLRHLTGLAVVASAIAVPAVAEARLQCVTYARQVSAVQLSGNARDWWGHADGVYTRGNTPRVGAVLAFRASRAMPMGHVAVVGKVIDDRHVLINHANWSRPGMVERQVMAVDVSDAGDWSQVRVWYAPTHSLGLRPSAAFGFIYPATETASADNAAKHG